VCASCNPTGARPAGTEAHPELADVENWGPQWIAANIPGWTRYSVTSTLYQSRYLSDSGRLFFNAHDGLVPQDVNGAGDVYEYEPPGVGGCSSSSVWFSERSGGCVDLISSGSSPEESAFLDASATGGRDAQGHEGGGDAFFLTSAKLSSQDFDTALDVYDAHECSTQSPCIAPPRAQPTPCTTSPSETSCRPAPSPQPEIFGSPSSATFSGAGNLVPSTSGPAVAPKSLTRAQKLARALASCRKKYKRSERRRAACERRARKQYAKQAKSRAKRGVRG